MIAQGTLRQLIVKHNNDYGFNAEDVINQANNYSELNSLSIVIPYYETGDIFSLMLDHLYNAIHYVEKRALANWSFEVIVVDDGSKNKKAKDLIKKKFDNIRVIESGRNQGRTKTRNIGLDNVKYEKCLFVDADILVAVEFLFYNLLVHVFSKKKVITVGFFQFIDKNNIITEKSILSCSDIKLNDYRIECVYGKTWIGCSDDKKFINRKFKIIEETNNFKNWPNDGFFGPWFLTNMVLGGFFMVDTEDAKRCNGFDLSFSGYGFTETSLPTKLVAGFRNYLVPITQGGCLHIDDEKLNVPRKEKDKIFWDRHDFYFNHYLNLTWGQSLDGYEKNRLNLIFHKIVNNQKDLKSRYDFVSDNAIELIDETQKILKGKNIGLTIFLDDGYDTQYEFAKEIIKKFKIKVFISLISGNIESEGYLSKEKIIELKNKGIKFCSHGVSHATLGKYENGKVLPTPKKGVYENSPRGHDKLLFEEEVRFQVIESSNQLCRMKLDVSSFVYPYGAYNNSIKKIIERSLLYNKAYTCEEELEHQGKSLFTIPRFVVYNDISLDNWLLSISEKIGG